MSSRKRKNEARGPAKRAGTAQRAPARRPWAMLIIAAAAVVAAVVLVVKSREPETNRPDASRAGTTATSPGTSAATREGATSVAAPAIEKLVGKWQRTDGDYALDVRRVGSDGRAEVTYSNPGPINVSRAEVKQDGGRLTLFVELRDVNYPGATYNLAYQQAQDALAGSYYQPALGQTYEVAFLRAE
jgi:uncharacterized protein (DUF2147 family)